MSSTPDHFQRFTETQFRQRLTILTERISTVDDAVLNSHGYPGKAGHIDVQVAKFFAEYIAWELEHPEIMKDTLLGNEEFVDNLRGPAAKTHASIDGSERERRFSFHIDYELTSSMDLLDQAVARLDRKAEWPKVPEIEWSQIVFENGYFRIGGRPVFTGGFNLMERSLVDTESYPDWADRDESLTRSFLIEMRKIGVGMLCIGVPVTGLLLADGSVSTSMVESIARRIEGVGQLGFKVDVLFNWHDAHGGMEHLSPGITAYYGNSIGFDIDHPDTKRMISRVMVELMPALQDLPAIVSWDMANEPFFDMSQWSPHSLEKYRAWLAERYSTIERLDDVWITKHSDFSDILLPQEVPQEQCSAGEWYDRVTFHNDRVTSFFAFVQSEIRRFIPDAVIHLKAQDNSSLGPRPEAVAEGIDREALTPISNLQGVDTRPLPVTEPRMAARTSSAGADSILNYDGTFYGFHWLGQSFLYDYLTSLEPQRPIVDFEYHAFSINAIRIPDISESHPRAALWMAHLHGLIGNMAWYWHRRYGQYPFPSDFYKMWLYGSISTQPSIAAEYFQTMLQLNMLAREVEALASDTRKPFRLLVSKPSYIQNQAHINALHRAYEGSCFSGLRVSFLTEQMLTDSGVPQDCRTVIMPDVEYISLAGLKALERAHEAGVQLIRFGECKLHFDAHGHPHPSKALAFVEEVLGISYGSAPAVAQKFERLLSPLASELPVRVQIVDGVGAFGIMSRQAHVNGQVVVLLVNVCDKPRSVRIDFHGSQIANGYDMLNCEPVRGARIEMPFQGVRLIRIQEPLTT